MSQWSLWAVLAPGEPARLESRARAIAMPDWDEEDGEEMPFEFIAGSGCYHAIVGTDPIDHPSERTAGNVRPRVDRCASAQLRGCARA